MKSISIMKKNIGDIEIMVRLMAAIVFADLAIDQATYGHWNLPFWVLAAVLGVTALTGWCPLYSLLHRHTGPHGHQRQ
jgi:hypothetical protein